MVIISFLPLIFGVLFSCELIGGDESKADEITNVTFIINGNFNFGNITTGYYPIKDSYLTGTFNNWAVADSSCKMTKQSNGNFSITKEFKKGSTIKFKIQCTTTYTIENEEPPIWISQMDSEYENRFVLSPLDVTFEDDGFEGINAVLLVP